VILDNGNKFFEINFCMGGRRKQISCVGGGGLALVWWCGLVREVVKRDNWK
jgi:hypothetical protein